MNKLGTWIYTKMFGVFIGEDQFGNKYYESKTASRALSRKHRWVYYSGEPEPSKVPSQWFNWLHYQLDEIPESNDKTHAWQIEHQVNSTGTSKAYYPKGHILGGAKRTKATGDYETWKP